MKELKNLKQLAAEHAESVFDEALHAPWTRVKPIIEEAFLAGAEAALRPDRAKEYDYGEEVMS